MPQDVYCEALRLWLERATRSFLQLRTSLLGRAAGEAGSYGARLSALNALEAAASTWCVLARPRV